MGYYVPVTFLVDLEYEEVNMTDGVHLTGNFQNWDPTSIEMTLVNSSLYEATSWLRKGFELNYLFVNGDELSEAETVPVDCATGGYRHLTVPDMPLSLAAVCYSECEDCSIFVVVAYIVNLLEGPYDATSGLMSTELRANDLIPIAQPFNTAPWNYSGDESVASLVDIPANATDWLLVELRSSTNVDSIVAQRAVFLLNNGFLQDVNGEAGAHFGGLTPGDYYIVLRSRNHLANMSVVAVPLPNSIITPIDFTNLFSVAGTNQLTALGNGEYGQFAGDFNSDGVITVADFNFYTVQASLVNQYVDSDANMDRAVTVGDFNLYQPNSSVIGIAEIRF